LPATSWVDDGRKVKSSPGLVAFASWGEGRVEADEDEHDPVRQGQGQRGSYESEGGVVDENDVQRYVNRCDDQEYDRRCARDT
jgi:hypothetical protein